MARILIKTDIGGTYGLGHAVRCKVLAQALAARGAQVEFYTTTPALAAFVAPFACHCDVDISQEAVMASILGYEPDIAVFDTTASFDEMLYPLISMGCACQEPADHKTTISIVRIDHSHATPETCDLLIAPGAHWALDSIVRLRSTFGERFVSGWAFVMLDEEVTRQAPAPYEQRKDGPIVFCAGGSDPTQTLETMCRWICESDFCPGVDKIALVGSHDVSGMAKMVRQVECSGGFTMASYQGRIRLRSFSHRWLREAALVVTMFGQTVYDCLAMRTPVLTFARTSDDLHAIGRLHHVGVNAAPCSYVPFWPNMTPLGFRMLIEAHMKTDIRQDMHAASAGLIDGHGIDRVANAILAIV